MCVCFQREKKFFQVGRNFFLGSRCNDQNNTAWGDTFFYPDFSTEFHICSYQSDHSQYASIFISENKLTISQFSSVNKKERNSINNFRFKSPFTSFKLSLNSFKAAAKKKKKKRFWYLEVLRHHFLMSNKVTAQ